MNSINKNKYLKTATITAVIISVFTVLVGVAGAQGYVPLAPLPGVGAGESVDLGKYLTAMFKIGIGIAGVFAVLMIVVGGIQFIGGASNPSERSAAKEKITNAIFGLILALSSWLILNTINPNLLKTGLDLKEIRVTTQTTKAPDEITRTETQYCYSKTSGIGHNKRTREVCGSSCPEGEACSAQQIDVPVQFCYSKISGIGHNKRAREVCGSSCPEGETCATK